MTEKPYVGEFRWQGEPNNSLIEVWNGEEWVLVSTPEPTDEELEACCEWLNREGWSGESRQLRAARRPKPPRTGAAR